MEGSWRNEMHRTQWRSTLAAYADRLMDMDVADIERYGFAVMRDGLPDDPDELATALAGLLSGLALLDSEVGSGRALSTFGGYFGREELAWFEDGYGRVSGLAVPARFEPAVLAAFVRPRIHEARL